jgi:hypothetical protein
VWLVTVGATDSLRVHLALQKAPVGEDLIALLTISVVQTGLDERQPEGIVQRLAGVVIVGELAAS